jgi:YHS domain-containing protein
MNIFITALLGTMLALAVTGTAFAGCPCSKGAQAMGAQASGNTERSTLSTEKATVAAQLEQNLICPVMGGKVNKDISYVYQGKTYYFCCPACIEQFKANPEKYIKSQEVPAAK